MTRLEVTDLLKFAVRIEENGSRFYKSVAEITVPDNKLLFLDLADEELRHGIIFQEFLDQSKVQSQDYMFDDEYYDYLRLFVDKELFGDKPETVSDALKSFDQAVDFAIRKELDSVVFYTNLKKFVGKSDYEKVDKIIREEEKHYARLSKMKA